MDDTACADNNPEREEVRPMKKRLGKKTLKKEALFWATAKNALDRDQVKVCRK